MIKLAREIDWSPPPRCPICGTGVTAFGQIHPFVVDANGRVYCREHGATVDPTYGEAMERYRQMREARARVLAYLQEGGQEATEEEVNQVLAELGG